MEHYSVGVSEELERLESMINQRLNNGLNDLVRKINGGLNGILQTITISSEKLERSISTEVTQSMKLLQFVGRGNDSSSDIQSLEINPMIKIDFIPANGFSNGVTGEDVENPLEMKPKKKKKSKQYNYPINIKKEQISSKNKMIMKKEMEDEPGEEYQLNNMTSYSQRRTQNSQVFDDGGVNCEKCDYIARDEKGIKNHIRNVHEKKYRCEECEYAARDKLSLSYHVRAIHEGKKDFKCTQCEYETGFNYALASHIKRNHNTVSE